MGKTPGEKAAFVKGVCTQLFPDRGTRYTFSSAGLPTEVPVRDIAAKIGDYSFKPENLRVFPDGIVGVPVTEQQAGFGDMTGGAAAEVENRPDNPAWDQARASWLYWWRHVCWWNDGATIGFFFPKCQAGPFMLNNFTMRPLRWLDTGSGR